MKNKFKITNALRRAQHAEVSEMRKNPVSNEWVLIATGRAQRPHGFKIKRAQFQQPRRECPFCNLHKGSQPVPVLFKDLDSKSNYSKKLKRVGDHQKFDNKIWSLIVIPNKYPAVIPGADFKAQHKGMYKVLPGRGHHEILITASHVLHMGRMPIDRVQEVIEAYKERFIDLCAKSYVNYISLFHNHGPEAGASLTHPHSQILAIPIVPRDVNSSLNGSKMYNLKNGRCVHCDMIKWEKKEKHRVVYENKDFIALCPYSSSVAFETRIYPKKHGSHFQHITPAQVKSLAECFKTILNKIYRSLNNPPYNFFLHTAPCDGTEKVQVEGGARYDHYHWHFVIMPKLSTWAGFELSTGMEISTVKPEYAADTLKRTKVVG